MATLSQKNDSLTKRKIIVAGGTGNVGGFIVRGLLAAGASVAVPSRSGEKLSGLRDYLASSLGKGEGSRLHTVIGDVTDETSARRMRTRLNEEWGRADVVIASLGRWHAVPSLLEAQPEDLQRPLDDYLLAHFKTARGFLPTLRETGGTYVFINGPLAFDVWPGSSGDLVSIATAAQHMLFRTLAAELEEDPVRIVELVTYAFLRNRQTQPGSPVTGEAVGEYVAALLSEASDALHGQSIRLKSADQLSDSRQAAAVGVV